ncbi:MULTISPECIES: PWWP domain-containing protein [Cupriavidus]|uniref:hypothetical protein n=1 Tax=Cupriavidus sp. DF5525 TaxID=3160989 RepID=UPI0005A167DC
MTSPGRLATCFTFGLLLTASAQASDIACKTTLRPSIARCDDPLAAGEACERVRDRHPTAATLICDYAMLRSKHEYIHAEQQQLLSAGAIEPDDVAAWRRRRDACTSVACLDSVFASWREHKSQTPIPRAAEPRPRAPDAPMRDVSKSKPAAVRPMAEIRRPPPVPKMASRATQPAPPRPAPPLAPQPPLELVLPAEIREHPAYPVAMDQPSPDPAPPPAAQPPPEAVVDTEIREPPVDPVGMDRPTPVPAPLWTPIYPVEAPQPDGWKFLGALAWLGMCGAVFIWWPRRMPGEWLPGTSRLRERARTATWSVLVSAGLVLNSILLLYILT